MQIENEIEKTRKRITLLEEQNAKFKELLDNTLEVTKQSASRTVLTQDENEFLQKTIELIEAEKIKLQDDLNLISTYITPGLLDNLVFLIKELEKELTNQRKELDDLRTEHIELKFLLKHADGDKCALLETILNLEDDTKKKPGAVLLKQRYRLQRKIVALEKRRCDLKTAIEGINNPETDEQVETFIKRDLENALFSAIDKVVRNDYEYLNAQVLQLEEERNELLGELQHVLDKSKREIASEYAKLQEKIAQIEREKVQMYGNLEDLKMKRVSYDIDNKQLESILSAFRNIEMNEEGTIPLKDGKECMEERLMLKPISPLPYCTIL